MKFDPASIVKIFQGETEFAEFVGTGFLVTSDYVVTCSHVVLGDRQGLSAGWQQEKDAGHIAIANLKLSFGADSELAAERKGTVVACGPPDLALINLDKPVKLPPIVLVSGLTSEHQAAISHGSVIGFSQTQNGRLVERPIEQVSLTWDFHTQHLVSMQIGGGLSRGMSGGPLIVRLTHQAVCVGMARMGGDGRASSQLIASDILVSFLTQNGVVPPLVFRELNQLPKSVAKRGTESKAHLRIFLCHSSKDKSAVYDLYCRLKSDGFQPWLDKEDLHPGQNWREEIPKAVRMSNVVVICLSKDFSKAGYRQREVRLALEAAQEQPEGSIFVIPLKLEECQIPGTLTDLHCANLFEEGGYDRLVKALNIRAAEVENSIRTPEPDFDSSPGGNQFNSE